MAAENAADFIPDWWKPASARDKAFERFAGFDPGFGSDWTATYGQEHLDVFLLNHSEELSRQNLHEAMSGQRHYARELIDDVTGRNILRIEANLAATHHSTTEFSYPANWIEAVKDRWLPAWLAKRWPVAYTTKVITARLLFPEMPPPAVVGTPILWIESVTP